MADGGLGGSGRASARGRRTMNPPLPRGGARTQMRTALGGKNILPSKIKTEPTSTSSVHAMRARPMSTINKAPKVAPAEVARMNDMYDMFLLDFDTRCLIEESKNLLEEEHLEAGMTECINLISSSKDLIKFYANKVLLKILDDLKQVDIISGAFDNLLDFAGEETLMEIQSLLVKKFEKITVKGAPIDKPVFEDIEVASLAETVQTRLSKNLDKTVVTGFVKEFNEQLKKLQFVSEQTLKRNAQLQNQNNIALEHCSLTICSIARERYQNSEQKEKDLDAARPGEQAEGGEERARLEED